MLLCSHFVLCGLFFFKQKTAYEIRPSDWSSDVCSSDLVGDEAAPQREDEREGVLRNGVSRIVADVGHHDATCAAGGDIDVVRAGCRDRDQPQPVEPRQDGSWRRRLVDDRERGPAEKGGDFRRCDAVVLRPGVRERRPAYGGLDRAALEEDDVLHHYLDCITCPLWRATLGVA